MKADSGREEVEMQDNEHKRLEEIIDRYNGQDGSLIQLLLDLQSEFNWISKMPSERSQRD